MKHVKSIGPEKLEEFLFDHLDRLERRIRSTNEAGEHPKFDVRIDGMRIVEPCRDPDQYEAFVNGLKPTGIDEIEVNVYRGNSRNCDKFIFQLTHTAPPPPPAQPLNGSEEWLQKQMVSLRQEMELDRLKRDYEQMEKDREEQEKYIEELLEELENFRSKRFYFGEVNLLDIGGVMLEGILKRNQAQILGLIAGAGSATSDEEGLDGTPREPKESDAHYIEILKQMEEEFTEEQLEKCIEMLALLTLYPDQIPSMLEQMVNVAKARAALEAIQAEGAPAENPQASNPEEQKAP
jgi:hypothetical protein